MKNPLRIFRTFFSLLAFLMLTTVSTAFADWEYRESGVTVDLVDVSFVDEMHGWAIGDGATIIATKDGGETWHEQQSPVESIEFKKIQCITENVGYIVGTSATILTTKDGGETWVISETGLDESFGILDLSFIDKNTGWIAAGYVKRYGHGKVLNTSDGGQILKPRFLIVKFIVLQNF